MSFFKTLRQLLLQSFLSLPLLLIGWSLFLGSLQGNIGLLVLFLGHFFAVPLTVLLENTFFEFIIKKLTGDPNYWFSFVQVNNSDVCNLIPGKTDYALPFVGVAPSLWVSQVLFFFSFLLSNAYGVYTMEPTPNADQEKVDRRKTQALISMIISGVLVALLLLGRKLLVGCETWTGLFVAVSTIPFLGFGWYKLARECSARDSDIFGIVQKILPEEAQQPPPMTCVYTG